MVGATILANPSLQADLDRVRLRVRYSIGQKVKAEVRFKTIVRDLLQAGLKPTPGRINYCLDRASDSSHSSGGTTLNGRETRWRREVLEEFGWSATYNGSGSTWIPPEGKEYR